MPKPEKVTNPSAAKTERTSRSVTPPLDGDPRRIPSLLDLSTEQDRFEAASSAFADILTRGDGWLRCIPAGDGKVNYFKYKFNSGKHSGKYVMYAGNYNNWVESMLGLWDKLDAVDKGRLKPAHDTFYDPR